MAGGNAPRRGPGDPAMSEFSTAGGTLAAWDAGVFVGSVEMGGIGPGYEQAIHVLVFELIRDLRAAPLPDEAAWPSWGDATVHRVAGWHACPRCRPPHSRQ